MAKKPATREELLAQIEALDNRTEVGELKTQIARLTEEADSLRAQRDEMEKRIRHLEGNMSTIRAALETGDRRHRPYAAPVLTPPPASSDGQPVRDLTAGTPKVTSTELSRVFPELLGPVVEISEQEAEAAYEALAATGLETAEA